MKLCFRILELSRNRVGTGKKLKKHDEWGSQFVCCGSESWEDWPNTTEVATGEINRTLWKYGNSKQYKIPKSCCMVMSGGKKLGNNEMAECQEHPESFKMRGCYIHYIQLSKTVKDNKSKVLGLAITSLLLMVTNMN